MRVAILGSGNGGVATAADWALAGHEVRIFDFETFSKQLDAISQNGGIHAKGDILGFAPIHYAGHSIQKVIDGAELILAVGPAYSTIPFAEAAKPYIKEGQDVIVCPGSCGGAFLFKTALGLAFEDPTIAVSETSTLPYACRITEPGHVHVYLKLKGGLYISSLPSTEVDRVHKAFSRIYNITQKAKSVFQTILQNGNPVIHPAVTLLNAGRIESTHGDFYFYEDGVMPGVGRLMKAVDDERIQIGKVLGVDILPDPNLGINQGYMTNNDYETGYSTAPGFKGIKAQSQLDHRYLNEDVGYGLVFMTALADKLNIDTPVMNSVIRIASTVMERDYKSESKRSLKTLGLEHYSIDELKQL